MILKNKKIAAIIGVLAIFSMVVAFLSFKSYQSKKVLNGEWVNIHENNVTTDISDSRVMTISGKEYSIKGYNTNLDVSGSFKVDPKDNKTGTVTFNHSEKTSAVGTYVNTGNYYLSENGDILQINLTGTENYDTSTTTIENSLMSPKNDYEYLFVKKGSKSYLAMKRNEEETRAKTKKAINDLKHNVQGTWVIKNKSEVENKYEYVSKIEVSGSKATVTLVEKTYERTLEKTEEKIKETKYQGRVGYYEDGFNVNGKSRKHFNTFDYSDGKITSSDVTLEKE